MNKKIIIAFICASLILITSFTVVAQESKVTSNRTDETNIGGSVNQLRIVFNEILEKYGSISNSVNISGIILNLLGLFVKILCYMVYYMVWIPLVYIAFFILLIVLG
jgi:hypothetical protein